MSNSSAIAVADVEGILTPDVVDDPPEASQSIETILNLAKADECENENAYELITRRSNSTNLRFACFLIAIRLGHDARQREEFLNLVWLIGGNHSYQEDWKDITGLCIAKEINEHSHLDIPSIVALANQNCFAYLWRAGQCDLANVRKAQWNRKKYEEAREESFNYEREAPLADDTANELRQIAKGLPEQVAVLVNCIADIYKNPAGLGSVRGETDTRIRLALVREAAKRLGLSEKQIKRHLNALKHPTSPELAAVKTTMTEAARLAQKWQKYPCSYPLASVELIRETEKRMKTDFQPYQFYKPLDRSIRSSTGEE